MTIHRRLAALGTAIPEILLPRPGIDLEKWAVIACDQYTQDRAYWKAAAEMAGNSPSTLNLIFPEVYLGDGDRQERIKAIHETMQDYLPAVFAPPRQACVYVERSTPGHPCRRGLVLALDLEQYNWAPDSRPLIRTTEGTVPARILPRMEVRRGAPLEIPHVLVLIDDDKDLLLPALGERARKSPPVYRTPLMMKAGTLSGWLLDREEDWNLLAEGLEGLAYRARTRYDDASPNPFLYAVGDGNHSLATAKAVWEEYKTAHAGEPGLADHPARWALVEIENLYDPGIAFEPIHRVLFGAQTTEVRDLLSALPGFSCGPVHSPEELSRLVGDPGAAKNRLGLITGTEYFLIETLVPGLIIDSLQPLLDGFLAERQNCSIDYLHGTEEVFRVAGPGKTGRGFAAGLLLPPFKKSGLFETTARRGPLPRKSFSMGEAWEKRFYFECRRLFLPEG